MQARHREVRSCQFCILTFVIILHLADITVGLVGEQDFAVMVRGVTEAHVNYVQKRQINLFLVSKINALSLMFARACHIDV
jgi:hypothetical protein